MKKWVVAVALGAAFCAWARPAPSPALSARLTSGPEVIGIIHWGLNTFQNREWGYGDADPAILDPAAFDADGIVGVAKSGGIGGLIVVAKHHDGFCLWPTKTTDYNIAKSPFRGGKGDYVKEISDACRRAGLEFGVYVSPWDRHDADYASPKYVEKYHAQIKELLGGAYGKVFEMWFDGANGGDGWYGGAKEKRTIGKDYYRFREVFRFVREMQPEVVIFAGEDDGSDLRWPGNERGDLDPDSRATIDSVDAHCKQVCGRAAYKKRINMGLPNGAFFRACEADFPLRKGWFWHKRDNGTTKNAAYLVQRYVSTVGNGGVMNIGLSPDKDGRIADEDAKALSGFKAMRDALFAHDAGNGEPFNVIVMREDVTKGENIDGWRIVADGKTLLEGKSIGAKRIRLLRESVTAENVEVRITEGFGKVEFKRYFADPELVATVLDAKSDAGETDTAKWMTGAAKEEAK